MNPLQCVRFRAERDAMKAAFPISLKVNPSTPVGVMDEDSGEVVDGAVSESETPGEKAAPPVAPAAVPLADDKPPTAEELKYFGPRPGANGSGAPAQQSAAAPPASNGNSIPEVTNDHVSQEPFWSIQFALGRWAADTGRPESEFKAALKAYVEHNGFKGYSSKRDTDYARQFVARHKKPAQEAAHVYAQ